ncbi:hypothetical protein DRO42_04910 [Candidatus Bathyarchaeota archaeon]|nr:MAG: hypothetical protein DRO42_04910 [Candidatus Bathyarchaeota archaeon]
MNPAEKIWWTKVVASLGVACLTLATQVFFSMSGSTSFMFGVLIYLVLSDVLSRLMGVDKSRGLKIGIGAYFFTWMTVWILLYTYFQTAG